MMEIKCEALLHFRSRGDRIWIFLFFEIFEFFEKKYLPIFGPNQIF